MALDGISLGKIERRRAVDEVHQAIREAILDRRFPPRMRLNVEELASQLGVSLTPVRSAIQLLAAEGLVDVHSRSGTFVATLTRRDLEEIFDIRCALECLAGELAVERMTSQQVDHARRLFLNMKRPVKNDEQLRIHELANLEFHQMIIQASGNRRLADMYDGLQAHIALCRLHRLDESWQSRLPMEQEDHKNILDALEKRDAKALVKALRNHILRAKSALLERVDPAE
jgi:DNA-binding GntR family transcriptional regulator